MSALSHSTTLVGETVGNYRVLELIAEGGMGRVFLAEHREMGRRAAVKVIHPRLAADDALVSRFLNEARACATLRHPNIVDLFDLGRLADGSPYVLMELLEGATLTWMIKSRGRLPIGLAVEIARQTADALEAVHARHIVHRDLKPDNLFLVSGGAESVTVKVLDFGVAKLGSDGPGFSGLRTEAGAMLGTPVYMAPEQFGEADRVDARADQYALGVIVFEMLSGGPPFAGKSMTDLAIAHQQSPVPPLAPAVEGVTPALDDVLHRALAKRPDQRFGSVRAFVEALAQAAQGSHSAAGALPTVIEAGEGAAPTVMADPRGAGNTPTDHRPGRAARRWRGPLLVGGACATAAALLGWAVYRERATTPGAPVPPAVATPIPPPPPTPVPPPQAAAEPPGRAVARPARTTPPKRSVKAAGFAPEPI